MRKGFPLHGVSDTDPPHELIILGVESMKFFYPVRQAGACGRVARAILAPGMEPLHGNYCTCC